MAVRTLEQPVRATESGLGFVVAERKSRDSAATVKAQLDYCEFAFVFVGEGALDPPAVRPFFKNIGWRTTAQKTGPKNGRV